MTHEQNHRPLEDRRGGERAPEVVARHDARTLTDGRDTAHIHLNGMTYTLRITRGGKLILTK